MAGITLLGRLDADTAMLRLRLQTLTRQLATGQRTEAPGDLAPQLPQALQLRAEAARRDTYGTAIGEALSRTQVMQQALSRLAEIAQEFGEDAAVKLDPADPQAISLTAERARQAMIEVGHLLNTQYAGEYLFGGSDFGNPPVPDPEGLPSSGFASQIAAAVGSLGGGNAAAVAAATRAAAQDDSARVTPFSAFLSDPATGLVEPRRSVPAEDGTLVPYGILANRNAAARSSGETTGSWARDLLRGLASMAALTPAQTASPGDFSQFAATIRDGLKSAIAGLADEAGALGLTEARLEDMQSRHEAVQTTLQAQLADIQEVDMAEVLSRLQATQTALEASYAAIGRIGALSLTQFLL
ncbi:MAG: flagellin [Acetobacteraceae bacterium]|nr:flagellin [Acetobacteraceae bacterium]